MVLKGLLLCLPLLFGILFLVSMVDKSQASYSYRNFLRRHVDTRRTTGDPHTYCQKQMKDRGLTSPTCMKRNTFIHARSRRVQIVCGVGGVRFNSTSSDSLASYHITTCRSKGGSPPDHCNYRGITERRRIRLTCSRGIPVRFRGILI